MELSSPSLITVHLVMRLVMADALLVFYCLFLSLYCWFAFKKAVRMLFFKAAHVVGFSSAQKVMLANTEIKTAGAKVNS